MSDLMKEVSWDRERYVALCLRFREPIQYKEGGRLDTYGPHAVSLERRASALESLADLQRAGQHIQEMRKAAKLSQREMARLAGISTKHLSDMERGRRRITIEWVNKLANAVSEFVRTK